MKYKDEFLKVAKWIEDNHEEVINLKLDQLDLWNDYYPVESRYDYNEKEYVLQLLFMHAIAQDELK